MQRSKSHVAIGIGFVLGSILVAGVIYFALMVFRSGPEDKPLVAYNQSNATNDVANDAGDDNGDETAGLPEAPEPVNAAPPVSELREED